MEIKNVLNRIKDSAMKYKYAVIVLIIGLALMLFPGQKKATVSSVKSNPSQVTSDNIETRLRDVLKQINGVGDVRVLLTLDSSGETIYQTDHESRTGENTQDEKYQTVIITDSERAQNGLIKKTTTPVYRGAVIVCTGGDQPYVKLAVTQAVMRSTNLKADQICVLKMK